MQAGPYLGMAMSNVITYFIKLDTGSALPYAHHNARIETASQAAEALRPVGGEFAFLSLAASIIGSGLLAVPSRFWD
jgi:Mn2+/Fe2+ NRAMP family transporter